MMFDNFKLKKDVFSSNLFESLKDLYYTVDAMQDSLNTVSGVFSKCSADTVESIALSASESMLDAVKERVYRTICSVCDIEEELPEITFTPDFSPALTQSELQAKCDELFDFDREDGDL